MHKPEVDWRVKAMTHLAEDVPAMYPGGPSHKAGAPVVAVTVGRVDGRGFTFTTPSQEALAINAAYRASRQAAELRKSLVLREVSAAPDPRPGAYVADESVPALYDFFEACYAAVIVRVATRKV